MTRLKNLLMLSFIFLLSFMFLSSENIKPNTENHESLKEFVDKNSLPIQLENCLFVKKLDDFKDFAFYRNYNRKKNNVNKLYNPDLYLFNKDFLMVYENALGGCYINRSNFEGRDYYTEILEKNVLQTKLNVEEPCSLEMLKGNLIDYKGNEVFPFKENKPCVLILWKNKKSTVEMINFLYSYTKQLLKDSKTEVDIYFLNIDNYTYS